MTQVKVQYAKTHLSALLTAVEQGEEFVIARGDKPIARLAPLDDRDERDVGFVAYTVPDDFSDPLPEDALTAWEGGA